MIYPHYSEVHHCDVKMGKGMLSTNGSTLSKEGDPS